MFMKAARAVTTLASLLSVALCFSAEVERGSLQIPQRLGNITLHHNTDGFIVRDQGMDVAVKSYMVDKELRGISSKDLSKILVNGGYIAVDNRSGSDYSLQLQGRINGGGPIGATVGAVAGKAAVHIAAQAVYGTISGVVGIFCPLAAGPVWYGLNATFATPVELASNAAAVACGIAGGVVTGPV